MLSPVESEKRTDACTACREKKVKCADSSGGETCNNCRRWTRTCTYPTSRRGKKPKIYNNHDNDQLRLRLADIQVIPYQPLELGVEVTTASQSQRGERNECYQDSIGLLSANTVRIQSSALATIHGEYPDGQPSLLSPVLTQNSPTQTTQQERLEVTDAITELEDDDIPSTKAYWEHHGPWSWVSVCSDSGIQWALERTQSREFEEMAHELTKAWSRRLRLSEQQAQPQASPELDEITAWKYVNAYFDTCYDRVFGIVQRSTFESRLRDHFRHLASGQKGQEDAAWYALRNIVYAAGCRCFLAEDPSVSFIEAQGEAFRLFKNALSVFTQLTFAYTGLTGVRALVMMSFYAEGLGCPALEYPLCANAAQAALMKGLHRQPSQKCGLSESEITNRNWLWWTIYCLEKQLAFRSGRPSLIDDDDISTKIPLMAPAGSTINVEAVTYLILQAQISAQISRRIMSVKAFKRSPIETIQTIQDIDAQLKSLLNSLPPHLLIPYSSKREFSSTSREIGAYYLHCAIYGSIMATHMILFYPWMSVRLGRASDTRFDDQIAESAKTIADAARRIILTLRSVNTNVATPAWLAFYYPMYAHINLFVHTLLYPEHPQAQSDLALLNVCAGHFGHMEHITSSTIAFHFPRDSVALAVRAVRKTKSKQSSEGPSSGLAAIGIETGGANSPAAPSNRINDSLFQVDSEIARGDLWSLSDFDVESWNIFAGYENGTSFDDFVV